MDTKTATVLRKRFCKRLILSLSIIYNCEDEFFPAQYFIGHFVAICFQQWYTYFVGLTVLIDSWMCETSKPSKTSDPVILMKL